MSGRDDEWRGVFNREAEDIDSEDVEKGPEAPDPTPGAVVGEVLANDARSIRRSLEIPLQPIAAWVERRNIERQTKLADAYEQGQRAVSALARATEDRARAELSLEQTIAETQSWTPERLRAKAEREFTLQEAREKEDLAKAEADLRTAEAERRRAEADRIAADEELAEAKLRRTAGLARRKDKRERILNPEPAREMPKRESEEERLQKQLEETIHHGTSGTASVMAEKIIKDLLKKAGFESEDELPPEMQEHIRQARLKAQNHDLSKDRKK